MSEETRRKAIEEAYSPDCSREGHGRRVDALTAHMRDELAPKPQPEAVCDECGGLNYVHQEVEAIGGIRWCSKSIGHHLKPKDYVKPTPAKCEECGCPRAGHFATDGACQFCHKQCASMKAQPSAKECATCGGYGGLPHSSRDDCPECGRRVGSVPSPTTEAPETEASNELVSASMFDRPEQASMVAPNEIWVGDDDPVDWDDMPSWSIHNESRKGDWVHFIRSDVVERRVAEASWDTVRALGAGPNESIATAARRVVASLNDERAVRKGLTEQLDTALAKVRELEGRNRDLGLASERAMLAHNDLVTGIAAAIERAETAERELGEARAELKEWHDWAMNGPVIRGES